MTFDDFSASLREEAPNAGLSAALQALWWIRTGDWARAHAVVMVAEDRDAAWVHAHLHRIEGDLANAGYWYRRAGQPSYTGALDAEWSDIARASCAKR